MATRALTQLEEEVARRVFQATLPYGKISIADTLAWGGRPFVVPTGFGRSSRYVLHLGPQGFANTLSAPRLQATFIHELTHVWQGYNHRFAWGYVLNSLWHQAVQGRLAYRYVPGWPWRSYNVEQQAQLVQDWFAGGELPHDPLFSYIHDHIRPPSP
jgi:hypothetical protein